MAIDKPIDISGANDAEIKEEIFAEDTPDVEPTLIPAPVAPVVSGYPQEDGSFHV